MKEQTKGLSPETLQEAAEGCIIIPMSDFLAILSLTKGEIERYTEQEKNPNAPLLNNVKRATYFKEVYTKVLGMTEKLFKSFESNQPQGVVRWVKASERKSEHYLRVCCRRVDYPFHWFTAMWDNSKMCYVTFNENNSWIQACDIEWLEEPNP